MLAAIGPSPRAPRPVDVRHTDEQNLLRSSARDFLARECPMTLVRQMMDDERGFTEELWQSIARLGWPSLVIDSAQGGAGLGLVDLCVLLEETGRALLPGPLLSSVAVGTAAVARCDNEELRKAWLPAVASGEKRLSVAWLEDLGSWASDGIATTAEPAGGGYTLRGTKLFVPDGESADALVVVARDTSSDALVIVLVDAASPGVSTSPIPYMDATRRVASVELDDVAVEAAAVLAGPSNGERLLGHVHDLARVALSAESIGGCQAVLNLSVEYAKTREQFGTPIGKFQAIQHRCADMLVALESARSAAYYAAWAIDNNEPDAHASACMAKAYCSETFAQVAGDGIQIHGGMGFTWDADLHIYYKRAKASELAFGDPAWNREQAARALLDAAG